MKKKILLVSSAGGHFSELQKLKIDDTFQTIYVTEKISATEKKDVNYYLKYGSREDIYRYPYVFIYNFLKAFKILFQEKPQVIISTGAHSAVPFFFIGKLFGIKNIYIESFALINSTSLTYKLSKYFIDLVIVQHKEMQKICKNAKYYNGGVY